MKSIAVDGNRSSESPVTKAASVERWANIDVSGCGQSLPLSVIKTKSR